MSYLPAMRTAAIFLLLTSCADPEWSDIDRAATDTLRIDTIIYVPNDRAGWDVVNGHTLEYREHNQDR